MRRGVVFDIKRFAIHDGPGIRVTFFLKGCPLDCWWCHNPEGLREVPGSEAREYRKDSVGPFGEWALSVGDVIDEIEKETVFLDESGGGVTFSGGEPMMQLDFLNYALAACKDRDIHTAVDTSGYAPADAFEIIAGKADLFLFDLKIMDEAEHRKYTGVSNRLINENLLNLSRGGARVIIRFPVIPGVTDREANIDAMGDFLLSANGIREIHLLPYHKAAGGKYERLRMSNRMVGVEPPSQERMETIQARLETKGFSVQIGG